MRTYKGWTGEQRMASLRKTKAAIATGEIPPPTKCNRCKQTKGIIHYHNHDYSDPVKFLEEMCWRCHMVLHSEHFAPEACAVYWAEIAAGKQYPPVYKSSPGILPRDHGIFKPRETVKGPQKGLGDFV